MPTTTAVSSTTKPAASTTSVKAPAANLKIGAKGAAAKQLQTALNSLGYKAGPADGWFGPMTQTALKAFQRAKGLTVDGVYGPQSRAALTKALAGSVKPPATKPPTTEPKPPTTGAKTPAPGVDLRRGDGGVTVKQLQSALKTAGFDPGPVDGDFGLRTDAALKKFQKSKGLTVDGFYGPQTRAALGKAVGGVAPPPKVTPGAEPPHDYRRISFRGATINVRTRHMIENAEAIMKKLGVPTPISITQGSYSHSVSASAGTHDGGGALDLRTRGMSKSQIANYVKALRMAGFAAWSRGNGNDSFSPHIHAIAIGDRDLSSSARNQVAEFFRGGDGLVGSRPDGDRAVGKPLPGWTAKYR